MNRATSRYADLTTEVNLYREQLAKLQKDIKELSASNILRYQRLEGLSAKLEEANVQRTVDIQDAIHKTRCEKTTKFQKRITRIKKKFKVVD